MRRLLVCFSLLAASVLTTPLLAQDFPVDIFVQTVTCKRMTAREAGSTDEISFAVRAGKVFTQEEDFDIKEGQTIERKKKIWSGAIAPDGEIIIKVHLLESDSVINVGGTPATQDIGEVQLVITRKGKSLTAKTDPSKSHLAVLLKDRDVVRFTDTGADYEVVFKIQAMVDGNATDIPFSR